MKRILSLVTLLLLTVASYAHVWEIRINQEQDGSLTWYLQSWHTIGQCGIANSGLNINGTNYPLLAEYVGSVVPLSNTVFAVTGTDIRLNYAIVRTPYIAGVLNVQPYSNNVCWAFAVGGSGSFTPPPPPICTSCPITGWSNANGTANNNGTACNRLDDYLPTTVTVNHLSCASITKGGKFRVVYDPSGANISYGPYSYTTGITTNVSLNLPYGVTSSTQLNVVSDSFPCNVAHGLTIPGGTFHGVLETVPPVIVCPANITVNNTTNTCGAAVTYATPTATDNCSGGLGAQKTLGFNGGTTFAATYSEQGMVINANNHIDAPWPIASGQGARIHSFYTSTWSYMSGQTFSPISVNIVANATSHRFISSTGAQISPTTTGTFTFPNTADWRGITSMQWNNLSGSDVDLDDFLFAEGGGGPLVTRTSAANTASGSVFPVGTTTVSYMATDSTGNTASCSFTVTVVDNQLPFIACPSNIGVNNDPGVCGAKVIYNAPVGTDNCPGATTTQIAGLASGATFPVGTTTNTFRVVDANNNSTTCSFTVKVTDVERPVVTCPANIAVNNDAGICGAVVNFNAPTSTDNCGVASTVQTAGLPSGATFPVGTTTNKFLVTDVNGVANVCDFTVTVTDNERPVIACAANIGVYNDARICGAVVNYTTPSGTDNCPGATTAQTAGLASGAVFPVGTTTNTFKVTDANGNSADCSFTVTVKDNEAPSITCASNIAVNNDLGICGAVVNYNAPVGTDNCPGATTAQTAGLASGSVFPLGTTTNTFVVTDAYNQTNTCSFTVTVTDNEAPSITCAANISVNNDAGVCGAVVTFNAPSTSDNCGVAGTAQTAGLASGATFPVGTTTNTFVVTDVNGNTNTCSFTVEVTDNEAPSITCATNIAVNNDADVCGAVVSFNAPSTSDNCGVAGTVQTAGLASGSTFPVGTTTNTFVVTDIHGNTNTCSFTVKVTDNQAPAAVCKNYTLNLSGGTGTVYPADVNNSSSDNCAIATMSVAPNTFTCANAGTNTVTLTVTDIHGNSSTCNATVTVQYQPTCTITTTPANSTYTGGNPNNIYLGYGPQSATITTNATGGTGFTYSWSPSTNLSCTNCQSPVFTPTAAGNYTYTVTATNSNGCSTTCIVKFCVMDIRVPGNGNSNKVYLCHVPPGNPNNPQTLSISVNAVPSHLGQHSGDRLGMCSMNCGSSSKGNGAEEIVYEEHSHEAAMELKQLKVYPNPNTGRFTIELPEQVNGGQAAILDMSGRVIRNVGFEKNTKLEIDLGSVSNGVYMVQILNSGNVYRALVTVQN